MATTSHLDHLFPTLTPAQAARILAHGRARELRPGEVLYEPGERTIPFVAVTKGKVEIVRPSAAGDVRAGSIKRVASAVGEDSIAVTFVHRTLHE